MTTLRRTLLATSLVAAGLLGAGSVAQAEELDVSTIYGRASPPNPHIIAAGSDFSVPRGTAAVETGTAPARADAGQAAQDYPTIVARETTNPATATPPSNTAVASDSEYLTTPSNAGASETVTTPTGKYLAVDRSGTTPTSAETARIHEEDLDGVPLVDGRGVRPGFDIADYAATVQTEPAFDVADVLGRSSPPAPEEAEPYFGVGS